MLVGEANVIPRLCVRIFNLWSESRLTEAIEAQQQLNAVNWVLTRAAIPVLNLLSRATVVTSAPRGDH